MKKRIVTITMIKNEADIVETFIRHTSAFATEMVFIDNGCVDGSVSIINAMKKEGINISVYNEADVFYEQFKLENKYIHIYAERDFDLIIPLDVDEFLACDNDLETELDSISDDAITIVKWRTYCLNPGIGESKNLFEKCSVLRINEKNAFTKVLIPTKFYRKNNVLVSMGHHDVIDEKNKKISDSLFVAHFPVRSRDQIRLKIYQGAIAQLMSSYKSIVAFHWKNLVDGMSGGCFDILKYSREYALYDEDKEIVDYEYSAFSCLKKTAYEERYGNYAHMDIGHTMFLMSQIYAVRQIITESSTKGRKAILVYGTGNTAENTLCRMDLSPYEIIAFVDSDENKCMNRFNGKIIISSDIIKHISCDLIVIASIYEDEIRKRLMEENIEQDKIVHYKDFIRFLY